MGSARVLNEAFACAGVARWMRVEDGGGHVDDCGYRLKRVRGDTTPGKRVDGEPQLTGDGQQIHSGVVETKLEAFRWTAPAAKENALVEGLVRVAVVGPRHPSDMGGVKRKLEHCCEPVKMIVDSVHENARHEAVVRGALKKGPREVRAERGRAGSCSC